ncbi:MAG: site-specific integrase [Defluviitaleaceae bacterium]|nr:site-specific integrase [Defluviitaleaceae bacterium]
MLFVDYFSDWIKTYKEGAVRRTTLDRYYRVLKFVQDNFPDVKVEEITRKVYQEMINKYAETRHIQTVKDFASMIKAVILDAVDDGLIAINPTRKTIYKGRTKSNRKRTFLNQEECQKLVAELDLVTPLVVVKPYKRDVYDTSGRKTTINVKYAVNWDFFILLCLHTGLRFSELLGLTPSDFDFKQNTVSVNKTYDYKYTNALTEEVKSKAAIRTVSIPRYLTKIFKNELKNTQENEPIFVPRDSARCFNSTVNNRLKRLCIRAGIEPISVHGLRHTHASILLYGGVSIHSISRRLGHSQVSMTQDIYMHIVKELESKDAKKINDCLMELTA